MTDEECLRYIREHYHAIIDEVAKRWGHRTEVLAGMMVRESRAGFSPCLDQPGPAGRGDNGHGHGLFQIDDRSYPEFCASEDWKNPYKNADKAADVLDEKRSFLVGYAGIYHLTEQQIERASIAAYNCGQGTVLNSIRQQEDPDTHTTGGDYSRDVLRLSLMYRTSFLAEDPAPTSVTEFEPIHMEGPVKPDKPPSLFDSLFKLFTRRT